jgi:hypothetical protein
VLGERGEQRLEAGRSPAACKMLFRLQPIVGASRA